MLGTALKHYLSNKSTCNKTSTQLHILKHLDTIVYVSNFAHKLIERLKKKTMNEDSNSRLLINTQKSSAFEISWRTFCGEVHILSMINIPLVLELGKGLPECIEIR